MKMNSEIKNDFHLVDLLRQFRAKYQISQGVTVNGDNTDRLLACSDFSTYMVKQATFNPNPVLTPEDPLYKMMLNCRALFFAS